MKPLICFNQIQVESPDDRTLSDIENEEEEVDELDEINLLIPDPVLKKRYAYIHHWATESLYDDRSEKNMFLTVVYASDMLTGEMYRLEPSEITVIEDLDGIFRLWVSSVTMDDEICHLVCEQDGMDIDFRFKTEEVKAFFPGIEYNRISKQEAKTFALYKMHRLLISKKNG